MNDRILALEVAVAALRVELAELKARQPFYVEPPRFGPPPVAWPERVEVTHEEFIADPRAVVTLARLREVAITKQGELQMLINRNLPPAEEE